MAAATMPPLLLPPLPPPPTPVDYRPFFCSHFNLRLPRRCRMAACRHATTAIVTFVINGELLNGIGRLSWLPLLIVVVAVRCCCCR